MARRVSAAAAAVMVMMAGACAQTGPATTSRRCVDTRFPIYFNSGSDQLTQPGRDVIAAQSHRLGACKIGAVEVLGLAEADGPVVTALELSQRRAAVVAQALAAAGLPAPSFDLQAEGAAGAVTPSGRKAPLHRRAEVVLHASPT